MTRVLALSPHTDDAEFGAGATLASFVREGHEAHVVAFSSCERSMPAGFAEDALRKEFALASATLGVTSSRVLGFDVRTMPEHRQRVLETMLELRSEFVPDLVLVPSRADVHQDHATIAAEAMRAFRGVSLLGYILPWNCPRVDVSAWRRVYAADVHRKMAALSCYESQRSRSYARAEVVRGHLVTGGVQAGCEYAEPYEVLRWVF